MLTVTQQNRIWEHFQSESPETFVSNQGRLAHLTRRIPRGSKVINVGVGSGDFERFAPRRGLDVHSLDPSERAIASLRAELSMAERAVTGVVQDMPFPDEQFDYVVASEVMEHLNASILEVSLSEIRRVLRRGGRFLGTVPAAEILERSHIHCPHCDATFHRWGHERSFSIDSMTDLLARYFHVESVTEKLFPSWRQLNWRGKSAAALKITLHKLGMRLSGASLMFVARK